MEKNGQANPWYLINKYFGEDKGRTLVKHLTESFNEFVMKNMEDIIEGFNTIDINHTFLPDDNVFKHVVSIDIKNPILSKPMICEKDGSTKIMTPIDARNRNFTYASPLYVDVYVTTAIYNQETKSYSDDKKKIANVCIGKIPIMVRSKYCVLQDVSTAGECLYDHGGYFIVNGNEKVVVSQNRIPENKPYVFSTNKASAYSHSVEIRSVSDNKFSVPKTTSIKLSAKPGQFGRIIRANIHYVKQDVPVVILFRALGVESDLDIVRHVFYDETDPLVDGLEGSIEEANHIMCQRDAIDYLSRHMNINEYPRDAASAVAKAKKLEMVRNVLTNEFMPHVGPDFSKKALYLGYMINKLLKVSTGLLPFDDRDSYVNKRIDTPGILLANLFRQYYGKVMKDMKNMINKEINNGAWKATNKFGNLINKVNITKIVKSNIIESGLKYGLATGNWGIKNNKTKLGVAQVLNRMNPHATSSHERRINTPVDKTVGKLVMPRKLHSTQYGIICPAETPEGASVGLVKNMSMIAGITISSNSTSVRDILTTDGVVLFDGKNIDIFAGGETKVLVNGDIVGVHPNPDQLYLVLKEKKRTGVFNVQTSVYWKVYAGEIWICTEGGRCVRPVIIVDPGNKTRYGPEQEHVIGSNKLAWPDCVVGCDMHGLPSLVEYIDVDEANMAMIAMTPADLEDMNIRHTHLEMHPSLMLGVLAGSIPFSDHNQAPRNCYQCLCSEEPVLMADGTWLPIKYVQIGDMVATFSPDTHMVSTTRVVAQFVRATEKRIYEVKTTSGRRIKATGDHKFFVQVGPTRLDPYIWMQVSDFVPFKTRVGIYNEQIGGPLLFADVLSIIEVPNCLIADITVESDYHCFIGGQGFAVHNSAMGKQAIGRYTSNFDQRYDTVGHVLDYVQKPMVQTKIGKISNNDELPSGNNVIVAIMTYTGYNQEDSVMMNLAAVQRGMFGSTEYATYKEQNNKNHSTGEEEFFCRPDTLAQQPKQLKPFNYSKLDESGFVPPDTFVESGDVIIGKCMPQKNGTVISNKDTSVIMKNNQSGYVDKIYRDCDGNVATNGEGYPFVKMSIRSDRIPSIGDKFCVPGDVEVFVLDSGWTAIKDVTRVMSVLQLDPVTRVASFGPVINTFVFYNNGPMIHVAGPSVDLLVTPDHKMLVSGNNKLLSLKVARDLDGSEAYYKGCDHLVIPHTVSYPYSWIPADELAYLYGSFSISGSLDPRTRTIRMVKTDKVYAILRLLNTGAEMDDEGRFKGPSSLYEFFNRVQNEIGYEQWVLVASSARAFIQGMVDGNGGSYVIGNRGQECLDDIQAIALAAGWCADVNEGNPRHLLIQQEVTTTDHVLSQEAFEGRVYCIEVPTHVFLVRSKGKSVWTGNSSRHGQKGTVGMLYRQEDMPFTADGTVPDIIINPHAIPSRMTIAQLMECIMGKACAALGTYGDATPFTGTSVEDISRELQKCGLERYGNEIMYNSRSGEQMATTIFIGPTYYQKLKHIVSNKVHCLTPDHEVLTMDGWVPIGHVTIHDKVATLDHDKLVYTRPLDVLEFAYDGFVYLVNSDHVDLAVTSEHKMYVSLDQGRTFGLHVVKDLIGKEAVYKKDADWDSDEFDIETIKHETLNLDEPLPSWVWALNKEHVNELLTFLKSKLVSTNTDVERLSLHAGTFANATVRPEQMTCSHYQGPVHCLQVPSEVFYVRRNGKACWTGNSRNNNGPVVRLTHQPAEGRARDGGLRLGEMEVECNLAHGISSFLKERLMECSDNYRIHVCKRCGIMATVNPENNIYSCKPCNNTTNFAELRIPYSCKLLMQEIQTMSIGTRFITN